VDNSENGAASPPTTPTPDPGQAVAALHALFSTLVPPDRITLTDVLGNEYAARAVLPARAQITIMQHLQRLWEAEVPGAQGIAEGGAAGVAGALVALAADPIILQGLCDAFQAAHPHIVEQAMQAAVSEGMQAGDSADVFPVEELVAGLVPFFIRFAARAADLAGQMMAPTDSPQMATAK
jgi:hypothetical protein